MTARSLGAGDRNRARHRAQKPTTFIDRRVGEISRHRAAVALAVLLLLYPIALLAWAFVSTR